MTAGVSGSMYAWKRGAMLPSDHASRPPKPGRTPALDSESHASGDDRTWSAAYDDAVFGKLQTLDPKGTISSFQPAIRPGSRSRQASLGGRKTLPLITQAPIRVMTGRRKLSKLNKSRPV